MSIFLIVRFSPAAPFEQNPLKKLMVEVDVETCSPEVEFTPVAVSVVEYLPKTKIPII